MKIPNFPTTPHAPARAIVTAALCLLFLPGHLRAAEWAGFTDASASLLTSTFSRLRVGIGDPIRDARDHVLSKFAPDEVQRLDELLDAAADAVEGWARDGTSKAANRFNTFQLREADADRLTAPGEVDGPPDESGVRRTKTGWRRVLSRKDDERDA